MDDAHFYDALSQATPPSQIVTYKTVGNRELRLHLFYPKGHKPTDKRAALLMAHGGGWVGGDATIAYPYTSHFARLGMVGVSLEYRLVKEGESQTVFDCVRDGRSAMRYLRQHAAELGIDPQRLVAGGSSAGGHVAAGTTLFDGVDEAGEETSISCAAQALVLLYPVIDTSAEGYGCARIGERWQEISPRHQVRPGLPPTIVLHGTADITTPFLGAEDFHRRMIAAGNVCELHPHPESGHGYLRKNRAAYEDAVIKLEAFFKQHGFLASR